MLSVRAPVGPVNICPIKSCIGRGLAAINGFGLVPHLYLFYFFKNSENDISKLGTGTTFKAIKKSDLENFAIPLPPLHEQHEIVNRIESLFSNLDAGVEALKKAKVQLKTYRQAVLKYAFEGKLTEGWRRAYRQAGHELEPADDLLQWIKEERDTLYQKQVDEWEEECIKAKEEGRKKPARPRMPKDLPPMTEEEVADLPELPDGWGWSYFGDAFKETPQNGIYKSSNFYGQGTYIIRIDDFYNGKLIKHSNFKKIELDSNEFSKYQLSNHDILINRVNSLPYLGKCGLVEKISDPVVFESNIMRIKILSHFYNHKYLTNYLSSYIGMVQIKKNAKHAVNQASINQTDVSITIIPFCSLPEQNQIVQEIESRFSVADKLEESIDQSLVQAKALRQSVLKMAFEGRLTERWRDENPELVTGENSAEALLERIKAEKACLSADKTSKKKDKK